jgi:Polyketide cyclase / dehydrase and lipid transport
MLIEESKSGDAVGAVRSVRMGDTRIRQRLLAHSDIDRFYTYEFCGPQRCPTLRNFRATLRATPIVDGNKAFIEWWTTYDSPVDE